MNQMTERAGVSRWLARYEAAWRTPGTADLARLFTPDATYLQSPYEQSATGLAAIGQLWSGNEDGRCTWFEEWPYWPEKPFAEPGDPA
jgi:ketosteroid isomerase-like protein